MLPLLSFYVIILSLYIHIVPSFLGVAQEIIIFVFFFFFFGFLRLSLFYGWNFMYLQRESKAKQSKTLTLYHVGKKQQSRSTKHFFCFYSLYFLSPNGPISTCLLIKEGLVIKFITLKTEKLPVSALSCPSSANNLGLL